MDRHERDHLLTRLRLDAARIADHFGLKYRSIDAEHPRVRSRYGVCYEDGLIRIRLNHAKTGEPLRYSSLIDTLCHELAHLRHFNHGPEFKAFFWTLLAWARKEGIYRPKARRPTTQPLSAEPPLNQPKQRNGVPVFAPPSTSSRRNQPLPWERQPGVLAGQLALAIADAPKVDDGHRRRRPARSAAAPRRQQLSLFD